jgi:ATP-binding protein involved in chromosome partitioning
VNLAATWRLERVGWAATTAVNLALALAAEGLRVGVLDADVYGPSVPAMLGLSGGRRVRTTSRSSRCGRWGGGDVDRLLVDQDTPMIWRGPMATSALTQLFNDTRWGDLDYLLVDLPPGTGDIQLTLAQKIPVAGAVIVTTPQDIATLDARKALKMFEKVDMPVLGIVENMAVHVCTQLRPCRAPVRRGRRRAHGRAVRRAAAGLAAAGHRHPRAGRCRHAGRGGAPDRPRGRPIATSPAWRRSWLAQLDKRPIAGLRSGIMVPPRCWAADPASRSRRPP